ncbi:ParB/RepB/Spo0J family partition protein [Schlesneria paludicola]|uniref:ParB/RepB/Spo0J family partition protein n=1 Tax=Schlesneria paludicola TaxID=360056 RepID=UPI00029A2F5F|nr:ParB/RepB/Spo0J family partition protein [Schlesneria paludicola]
MATTAQTSRPEKKGADKRLKIVNVAIADIRPSPENDTLYRPVLASDPEINSLAQSIKAIGLREPLVLTLDGYILSGHRRFMASKIARLTEVPCRYENIRRIDEPDRFVVLLREFNRQRVKALDEQLRESVVDIDPEEARAELINYRREKSKVDHDQLLLGSYKRRKAISPAKTPMVEAIFRALEKLKGILPVSDRQIHYVLLNNPPLIHASKPESRYRNNIASYKSLVELLTRMRLNGLISFEAIADETRPVTIWNVSREPGAFIATEMNEFLKGYFRDLMQSQPNHVELLCEKNTVARIVTDVASEFCLPVTSARGFCSLPPRHAMAKRFRKSGKSKLVVLIVSDFDADGECIAESFGRSMRDDFEIGDIVPIKVALTHEQVLKYNLPQGLEAKSETARSRAFIEKFGANSWELEALPHETLQQIIRDTIANVIDMDLFEQERVAEDRDAARLKGIRDLMQKNFASFVMEVDAQ